MKKSLKDFTFPENINWLYDRTCLLCITGSHAYGTNIETSDVDYKGVCVPPSEYYFGLNAFNEYNTAGGKNFKNTSDDIDVSIIHLNKFVLDAMQGVPNNIELLFMNPEFILHKNWVGDELIGIRHMFLTKAIKHKFSGYAHSQKMKLLNLKSNGAARQDLVDKYGFDTKYALHSVRLLTSAIEILKTGDFSTYRHDRKELISIRNGKYTLEQIIKIIDDLDKEVTELYQTSTLPYSPDYDKINEWLIKINKCYLCKD
jgi:predicted nucleotidyltransferase